MNPADDPKVHDAIRSVFTAARDFRPASRTSFDLIVALDRLGVELAPKGLTDAVRGRWIRDDATAPEAVLIIRHWDEEHP